MIASGQLPAPDRVLIIKPSALGDVVTAAPVLRGLRRSFPRARCRRRARRWSVTKALWTT